MCYRQILKKDYDVLVIRNKCVVEQINTKLPSWTGGVPRQMSEAILDRRGGGLPTVSDPVILSAAKELASLFFHHHLPKGTGMH